MIQSIDIQNFRCFHHTTGKDFSRINLIGGKNNAGKTALLEALLLLNKPNVQSITTLSKLRSIDSDFMASFPKKSWDNLFFNQNKQKPILIEGVTRTAKKRNLEIVYDELLEDWNEYKESEFEDTSKAALHLYYGEKGDKTKRNSIISSETGIRFRSSRLAFENTQLIPALIKINNENLAELFDKAKLEGKADVLLQVFQLIDDSIEKVETLSVGKSAIYLKRKGENYTPLTLFGDAMNKVADFILRIINKRSSTILIDEIENGIHHTNQEKLWEMLFKLAKAFDVQIFATTHSAEMITSFKNITIDSEYREDARYFEMARHEVSNEITINKIPIDALEYKLNHNKPLRGE